MRIHPTVSGRTDSPIEPRRPALAMLARAITTARSGLLPISVMLAFSFCALAAPADDGDPANAAPAATAGTGATAPSPGSARQLLNVDGNDLALQGYDPVAYFVEGKATPGDPGLQSIWKGAVYRFASAEHKRRFDADPARYVPAFGGYCAYGASIDALVSVDPTVFQIVDGRLLLQYDRQAYERFNTDASANLDRADANWPGLVEKYGTQDGPPSVANRVRRLLGF
jgi:YHS domain-containing protein